MKKYQVTIIGASGLVGRTIIKVLQEEEFPIETLNLFASEKSKGLSFDFTDKMYYVNELSDELHRSDFCLFATNDLISKKYISTALKQSKIVIDNSSAFRLNNDVPLIVPEVNFDAIGGSRLISNPNCSTAICVIPLWMIDKLYGIERVRINTYQSVSGSGKSGISALKGENNGCYPYDIRKTCIPKVGEVKECGYTSEEIKMRDELRKILSKPLLPVSATCVRVPVERCHSICVSVELKHKPNVNYLKQVFAENSAITVVDDLQNNIYPTSTIATDRNKIYIGRIREDFAKENSLLFYLTSDNLRRGAAYNAVKIMQCIIKNRII